MGGIPAWEPVVTGIVITRNNRLSQLHDAETKD